MSDLAPRSTRPCVAPVPTTLGIPARAGIQRLSCRAGLDARLRGHDGQGGAQ